jgi:hypothetical protein
VNSIGHSTGLSLFPPASPCSLAELTAWLSVYQLSRDMVPRGIVEVIWDD